MGAEQIKAEVLDKGLSAKGNEQTVKVPSSPENPVSVPSTR